MSLSHLKLLVTIALCCIVFSDQTVYCSSSFEYDRAGSVSEAVGHLAHPSGSADEAKRTQVDATDANVPSLEYGVDGAEVDSAHTDRCVCADKREAPAAADQARKAEGPRVARSGGLANKHRVITITLPEGLGVDAIVEAEPEAPTVAFKAAGTESKADKAVEAEKDVEAAARPVVGDSSEAERDEATVAKDQRPEEPKSASDKSSKDKNKEAKRSKRDVKGKAKRGEKKSFERQRKDGKSKMNKGDKKRK